jgi:hypothetical protein
MPSCLPVSNQRRASMYAAVRQLGAIANLAARHLATQVVILDATGDGTEVVLLAPRCQHADVRHYD